MAPQAEMDEPVGAPDAAPKKRRFFSRAGPQQLTPEQREEAERLRKLAATYVAQSDERILFSWHCSSVQTGPNMLAEDSILIRKGTAGTPS